MRVTLNLPFNLLNAAKHLAAERSVSLDDVISELALKGLVMQDQPVLARKNEFPVFIVPPDAPTLNLLDVRRDEMSDYAG